MKRLLLLFLASCGGAEFSPLLSEASQDAATDAASSEDAATDAAATTDGPTNLDASPDTSPIDSAAADTSAADTSPVCTPIVAAPWTCGGVIITPPGQACALDPPNGYAAYGPINAECRDCLEHFTCACLQEQFRSIHGFTPSCSGQGVELTLVDLNQ